MAKAPHRAGAPQGGRPSIYTEAIAKEICARMAKGESVRRICTDEHMPDRETIARWVIDDIDGFAAKYAHARELQADELFDSAQDVAETHEDVNRAKLIVSTIQWRADKLAPKKYGPRIELEHNGSLEVTADKALERLESSLSKALEQLGL